MKIKLIGKTGNNDVISSCAGRLSRANGTVSDVYNMSKGKTKEQNINFVEKVVGMGHTSIIDHVYFNFAIEDVTPMIEQLLIESRYCSLTIKSRREANFAEKKYYKPSFEGKNKKELLKEYNENMDRLFDAYQVFVDEGIKVEDARYILPYCFYSQILFGADATELIRIINLFEYGSYSHMKEAKEFGEKLHKEVSKVAPYIDSVLENVKYKDENPIKDVINNYIPNKNISDCKTVAINESEFSKIDETIAINAISRIKQVDIDTAKKQLKTLSKEDSTFMPKLFRAINDDYVKSDLKTISLKFQFTISFANLTHITRHRGVALSIPDFVPNLCLERYIIPESISSNEKLLKLFKDIYKSNIDLYNKFKDSGIREEDLVYFALSCNQVNVTATFSGDTFKHVSSLRVCRKAQWEIRKILKDMVDIVEKHSEYYSKIVGANCAVTGICPEKFECCKNPYPNKKIIIEEK
ncbi:MAG: FAD-dependent thymidylate synthase [bacterium]